MRSVGLDCSALDPQFKEHAQRGIGRYVRELAKFFESSNDREPHVGTFDHRRLQGGLFDTLVEYVPFGRQTLRQQLIYPLRLSGKRLREFDILHFPAHMDAPAWTAKPYVLTVLDLIPLVLADLYKVDRPSWRFKFARWLEIQAIKNASLILAISENTARDVERVLGVPADRIVVTPLGVDAKFFDVFDSARLHGDASRRDEALLSRLGVPRDRQIILYVGGIDQRKNVGFMLDVIAEIKRRAIERGQAVPVALLVGKIDQDRQYPALLKKRAQLGLDNDVILGGFVTDADLLSLYASSDVFFFPSLYEGFGLPVLEAMAAGLPVVSSNSSSLPEVIGSAGAMFDPHDVASAVANLSSLLQNNELRQETRKMGHARARLFTWEKTGAATLDAYRAALQSTKIVETNGRGARFANVAQNRSDIHGSRRDVAI